MGAPAKRAVKFVLLVYRMPTKPTAGRVAVWRQLKRIGSIYLHQSVCVFPESARTRRELQPILNRITQSKGEYHLLPLRLPSNEEHTKLVAEFRYQTSRQYQEIIENCEVNFQKEIQFETFRENFTYEEAEEIRNEFDKIVGWFEQVRSRDWFDAPNREEAQTWLRKCEELLLEFERRVYQLEEKHGRSEHLSEDRRNRRGRRRGRVLALSSLGTIEEFANGDGPSRSNVSSASSEGPDPSTTLRQKSSKVRQSSKR